MEITNHSIICELCAETETTLKFKIYEFLRLGFQVKITKITEFTI